MEISILQDFDFWNDSLEKVLPSVKLQCIPLRNLALSLRCASVCKS